MASNKLRNNNGIDVNDPAIRKAFPSVFNKRRSTNVSEDYQLYRSDDVIRIMANHGLNLVEVSQEKMGWSKKRFPHTQIHTMRFTAPEIALRDFGVGDSRPEVVVMNSHDGRCVFRAMAGVYRLVCSNGMIVADQQFGSVVRRHYGEANAFSKVKEIIADMPRVVEVVSNRIADWSALPLDNKAQIALAKLCMKERNAPEWLHPEQVLEHRRDGEQVDSNGHRDLWKTFNVLQENLTNAQVARIGGEGRGRSILPITGTVGNVATNQKLWAAAEAYAEERIGKLKGDAKEAFEKVRTERAAKKPIKLKALADA
jgi:predicted kinase